MCPIVERMDHDHGICAQRQMPLVDVMLDTSLASGLDEPAQIDWLVSPIRFLVDSCCDMGAERIVQRVQPDVAAGWADIVIEGNGELVLGVRNEWEVRIVGLQESWATEIEMVVVDFDENYGCSVEGSRQRGCVGVVCQIEKHSASTGTFGVEVGSLCWLYEAREWVRWGASWDLYLGLFVKCENYFFAAVLFVCVAHCFFSRLPFFLCVLLLQKYKHNIHQ